MGIIQRLRVKKKCPKHFKATSERIWPFCEFLANAMHSSASMLKQMFVQPTPPLHTAVAGAKSQYVTPFIAMYYVILIPASAVQAARALYYHIVLISSASQSIKVGTCMHAFSFKVYTMGHF